MAKVQKTGLNVTGGAGASIVPGQMQRTRQKLSAFDKRVLGSLRKTAEPNYYDTGFLSSGIDFSGGISDLSAVAQGNTDSNRIGDQITPVSLEIRMNSVLGDTTNLLRATVFRWNEPSTPTMTQIFTINATANAPLSPFNADNMRQGRFEVVKDWLIGLDAAHVNVVTEFKTKLPKGRAIGFNGGTTTGVGKLYLALCSDSGAAPNPQVALQSRLIFITDL